MGSDFSWLGANKGIVEVTRDETSLSSVKPAFRELQRCTGVNIDPYGDSRISPDHARLLIKSIAATDTASNPDVRAFVEMLGQGCTG